MHRLRLPVSVLAVVLLLAGCPAEEPDQQGSPEPTEAGAPAESPSPTPAEEPTAEPSPDEAEPGTDLGAECTNPDGFTVAYPEDWTANSEPVDQLPPCSLFDPESVDTGETMQVPLTIAAFLRFEPVDFEPEGDPQFAEELERTELTVDGHDALRIESESTGGGMIPEGARTTTYRVDVDGEDTFVATTHDVGDTDYAEKQRVLDEMMATITFER